MLRNTDNSIAAENRNLKPAPLFPGAARHNCPVCGEATYSLDRIHPQCAQQQADEPRSRQLRLERIRKAFRAKKNP
jgi:hypothetical protein